MRVRLGRAAIGWILFDFAVSFLMANGGVYFPAWLVINNHVSDLALNVTIAAATLVALLTGPLLGRVADRFGRSLSFLAGASAFLAATPLALHVAAVSDGGRGLHGFVGLVGLFAIFLSFQLAGVFYNAILRRISTEQDFARFSGLGVTASWLGAIVGLLVVLPVVQGALPYPFLSGRAGAFLPSALVFIVLVIPALLLMRSAPADSLAVKKPETSRVSIWATILHDRAMLWLLVAVMLFMDAILTVQNNLAIYLDQTEGMRDEGAAFAFLTLFIAAAIGGLMSIWLLRRTKALRLLPMLMIAWTLLLIGMSVTSGGLATYGALAVAGVLFGATVSVSRVAYLAFVPETRANEYFGIYASFERTASILGPLVWGAVLATSASMGTAKYEIALGALAVFTLLGAVAARLAARQTAPRTT